MIPFKSFIRMLCNAVNTASADCQTELDSVISGFFTKESDNGTCIYSPREVKFRIPSTGDDGQPDYRTVSVPLAALANPQTMHLDKIRFTVKCSLAVRSGELIMDRPSRFRLFRKGMDTRIEFTLAAGGNPQELEDLIAHYEASLRNEVEK